MSNVKEIYIESIPKIMTSLKLENKMEVPRIVKVVLNMGLGIDGNDSKIIKSC